MKLEELLQQLQREQTSYASVREREHQEAQALVRKVLARWGITAEDGWQVRESTTTGLEDGFVIAHPQLPRVVTVIRGPRFDTLAVPAHPADERGGPVTPVATAMELVEIMRFPPVAEPATQEGARHAPEDPLASIAASLRTLAVAAEMWMSLMLPGDAVEVDDADHGKS